MAKGKLFISYSRNDLDFVTRLVKGLGKEGIEASFDPEANIGDGYDGFAEREIKAAEFFLVVLSKAYVGEEFLMDELSFAMQLGKTIVPVIIEDCKVPMRLAKIQQIDLRDDDHRERGIQKLISILISRMDIRVERPATAAPPVPISKEGTNLEEEVETQIGSATPPPYPRSKKGSSRGKNWLGGILGGLFGKRSDTEVVMSGRGDIVLGDKIETGTSQLPETGLLAHSIPTKMQLQNTHRCIIRIGFDEDTIIKNFPEASRENIVKKDIRVSDVMEVEFLANPHFEIVALNSIKQPIDTYGHTEWNFDVKPKSIGAFPLTFKISVFLANGSKEMILRETVTVITEEVATGEVFIPAELMSLAEYYKQTNKKIKIIRLFLASSSELMEDRRAFEILMRRKNKQLIKENIYLELSIWEDFLDAMSATRLQDEYNKAIENCDVFISLFHTKAGRYTKEEFLKALETFKENKKPLIYTYFKDTSVETDSLKSFKKELGALGHFYTRYKNMNDLNQKFGDQIPKFLPLIK